MLENSYRPPSTKAVPYNSSLFRAAFLITFGLCVVSTLR